METEQKKQRENVQTEQETEKESFQEAWEDEPVFSGFVWPRWLRRGAAFGGVLLILGGGAGIWMGVRRQQETKETVLADYEVYTEESARVHLLPNSLYETEWLEAGQVCAVNLTDYLELTFSAKAGVSGSMAENEAEQKTGSGQEKGSGGRSETESDMDRQTQIAGEAHVSAVLTGYQVSGDSKKTVYEQRKVLSEQKTSGEFTQTGRAAADSARQPDPGVLDMTLQIRPSDYLEQAEAADRILGGSVSRSLMLEFEGSFTVSAGGQSVDEPFSCQVELPLAAPGSFYEISLPQPDRKSGQITDTKTETRPVRGRKIVAGAAGILAGGFLIWFVLWLTREPDAQELWERRMRGLLRKYGSQLFEVEMLPWAEEKSRIRLCSLDSLIQISEDLHSPVLYAQDENGLPDQGHFLVTGETACYEVVLAKPAPLVEDEGPEGGK